ncbi:putative acyl-CoA dehydrogenase [Mycolicibacterium smegmatis MKD8]|uniref:Putative acyl-CoA dehydrogenase n=1 Tax=Mycolicibacterium smegmatis (strain MKD8) TaxID=1214915 RepID=A0A2U9PUH6_MYCSE|nr:putative acyl-CoA dehydrogenase [Mycolicibacterium smegmatis MKD8]
MLRAPRSASTNSRHARGWLLFETGGATSARTGLDLDRHWRNARTLASHNPDSYKLRYLGDHLLNGATPPTGSFF